MPVRCATLLRGQPFLSEELCPGLSVPRSDATNQASRGEVDVTGGIINLKAWDRDAAKQKVVSSD